MDALDHLIGEKRQDEEFVARLRRFMEQEREVLASLAGYAERR